VIEYVPANANTIRSLSCNETPDASDVPFKEMGCADAVLISGWSVVS
jgi:hypothetical protein